MTVQLIGRRCSICKDALVAGQIIGHLVACKEGISIGYGITWDTVPKTEDSNFCGPSCATAAFLNSTLPTLAQMQMELAKARAKLPARLPS